MKNRLLEKVRKDYSIIYYPEGYKSKWGNYYFKNAYVLFFKDEIIKASFEKNTLIDYVIKHFREELGKKRLVQLMMITQIKS